MTITMQPTAELVNVEGVTTRRWMGVTETGTPVDIFVRVLRVASMEDQAQFELELTKMPEPYTEAIDLRRVL